MPTISYLYDADGQLTKAGSLTISRGAEHGLPTQTVLNLITGDTTYTPRGEPLSVSFAQGTTPIWSQSYLRDAGGRITQVDENLGGVIAVETYAYDKDGRLSEVKHDGSLALRLTYDANGNWKTGSARPAAR